MEENIMRNNLVKHILVAFLIFSVSLPAYAISQGTSKALEAFRRYETDLVKSLRNMEELGRRVQNENLDINSGKGAALKEDAIEIYEFVQKRYDILDDLYKSVSAGNPDDRGVLLEGFQRIDDLYRQVRDYFHLRFEENQPVQGDRPSAKPRDEKPAEPLKPETKGQSSLPPATTGTAPKVSSEPAAEKGKDEGRGRLTGKLKVDLKNKNEVYNTTPETALPNNYNQAKLSLKYDLDEKNKIYLDDKYLYRRRNEPVYENVMTFNFFHTHSKKTSLSLKDTLHHVKYPDATIKDYRDNLAEIYWNKKEGRWERLYSFGYQNRDYPNYSKSDFRQLNYSGQTTFFINNGTLFGEATYNGRNYNNSSNLDYTNANLNFEYNQSFEGNKSETTVSNVYDMRRYGNEAVNLFRTNYWDDYFTFRYNLPVSKTFTWLFEDDYQERRYPSDEPRGYAQVKLKTTAKITIDKNSRAKVSHTYIFNNERTMVRAHKNNIFNAGWDKKICDTFRFKIDGNYHRRSSMIADTMDFKEYSIGARGVWKLPSKVELTWKNEYLQRKYSALFFPDYYYVQSGLIAYYAKPKKYDWQLEQSFRKFSFRNGKNVATDWNSQAQPYTELKINYTLKKDLRLKFAAYREKTYYKYFDSLPQELLWDFTKPLTVTEFTGGFEFDF